MIYIVSQHNAHDALQAIPNLTWWAFMSDAKKEANRLANLNASPFYIYSFEQQDCVEPVEPLKTYRISFERIDREYITATGTDVADAIAKARSGYPSDVWECYDVAEIKEGENEA